MRAVRVLRAARENLRAVWHDQGGFTFIEMITVLLVIGILTALLIANTRVGDRRQQLRDSAAGFVSHVRNVEARAAGAEPVPGDDGKEVSRKAYGICVSSTTTTSPCAPPVSGFADEYQLYARRLGDTNYARRPDNPDILETVVLSGDVELSATAGWLDFLPPQPEMLVIGSSANRLVDMRQKGVTGCTSTNPDCVRIFFKPKSGAAYVQ